MSAKNIKELNEKLENMQAQFVTEIKNFKSGILSQLNAEGTDSSSLSKVEFQEKFSKFEDYVNRSIGELKRDIQCLVDKLDSSSKILSQHIQHLNNKKVLIHGLKLPNDNNLFINILELLNSKMNLELKKEDISNFYRLGEKMEKNGKKLIVVEFVHQWKRDLVFFNKKLLKGSGVLITEVLSEHQLKLFNSTRQHTIVNKLGKNIVWTMYGTVFVLHGGMKKVIRSVNDINNLK